MTDKDMVLVPRVPTEEMIRAAAGGAVFDSRTAEVFRKGLLANWRDMLAASPVGEKEPAPETTKDGA